MSKSYARLSLAPKTIVGYRVDGRPIYNIAGGNGEGGEAGGENASGDGGSTPTSTAGNGAEGSEGSNKDGDPSKKIAALEDEKDRHYRKRVETERELEKVANRLKELEDKDKSELERTQSRVKELEDTNATLQKELDDLRLDNAILADSKHNWRDRKAVLRLLDRSGIEFKDGKPSGLEAALKSLAQESPYLLAEEKKGPEDPGKGQPSSGKAPASRDGNKPQQTREDLAKRYPGLRR